MYAIDHPQIDPPALPEPPEAPPTHVYVLVEISAPNMEDFTEEDSNEVCAEMEQRTTRDFIKRELATGCWDVIGVRATVDGVPEIR